MARTVASSSSSPSSLIDGGEGARQIRSSNFVITDGAEIEKWLRGKGNAEHNTRRKPARLQVATQPAAASNASLDIMYMYVYGEWLCWGISYRVMRILLACESEEQEIENGGKTSEYYLYGVQKYHVMDTWHPNCEILYVT